MLLHFSVRRFLCAPGQALATVSTLAEAYRWLGPQFEKHGLELPLSIRELEEVVQDIREGRRT